MYMYACMCTQLQLWREGGRERGTSGQWKTTEKVTKKCTHAHAHVHTHTHTHTHTHLSCPVYRLSYNSHATLIDEEAKSKHLTLGVLIMFSSCTTSVHCYPSLAQEGGDHIYVLSGLQCCGTSGCSWGIAQHHAVPTLASVAQQYICALLCRPPYGSIFYTLGTAPGSVAGQYVAAAGHDVPAPGYRSHASLLWRGLPHTTPLLEPPQPSGPGESGLSISSRAPLWAWLGQPPK